MSVGWKDSDGEEEKRKTVFDYFWRARARQAGHACPAWPILMLYMARCHNICVPSAYVYNAMTTPKTRLSIRLMERETTRNQGS